MDQIASARGQRAPAEVYEELFVPALFEPWGQLLSQLAELRPGDHVLDVACGTGALARAAAQRVGVESNVVGLDIQRDMLAVARRRAPGIEWREGAAEALPFPDESFDAVLSQFGLMFFRDRSAALGEMARVARPGGRLLVAVWDALAHSPGYAALDALLRESFGSSVSDAFRAPFALGDPAQLRGLCQRAGWAGVRVSARRETLHFASLEAMLAAERACVWTLGGLLDDRQFEQLLARARGAFVPFSVAGGAIAFPVSALIATSSRN